MPILEQATTGCTASESMRSYVHRRHTTFTPPEMTMLTALEIETVFPTLADAQAHLDLASAAILHHNQKIQYDKNWDTFLKVELKKVFKKKQVELILSGLKDSRRAEDYRQMTTVYAKICGRIRMETQPERLFLHTVVAADALKQGAGKMNSCYKSKIRSWSVCPECGTLAKTFMDRLNKEGIKI